MLQISFSKHQADVMRHWYVGLQRRILGDPRWAPLRPLYPVTAEAMADLMSSHSHHGTIVSNVHCMLDQPVAGAIAAAIDEFLRQDLGVPVSAHLDSPAVIRGATVLTELGHVDLPRLDAGIVVDMLAYFSKQPVYPGSYVAGPERCTLKEARGGNFASFPITTVFACPHLVEVANAPETLAIVEHFLGTTPSILGYCAWWSFARPERPIEAQLYHRDADDYRFVKLFIYLTDVGPDDGPHTFQERTHDPAYLAQVRDRWSGGREEFDRWMFRTLRKTDGQVRRVLETEPITKTGPKGSRFLASTSGIHKGPPPQKSDRLVCQVLYGVSPRLQETFVPLRMGTPETAHIPPSVMLPPGDYVNRLFVEPATAR